MDAGSEEVLNSFGICTWQDISECGDCSLASRLSCRFDWRKTVMFWLLCLTPTVAAIAGMIRSGFSWYLLGWAGVVIFFRLVGDGRALCSHCPYWAREGRVLRCHSNHGMIKLWRYRPAPLNRAEQTVFVISQLIIWAYPFPFLVVSREYILALVMACGVAAMSWYTRQHKCARCANFSCPLNGMPKEVVDAYLRRNPVMREAWEKSGYRLDG
jgi:hypothetical protein